MRTWRTVLGSSLGWFVVTATGTLTILLVLGWPALRIEYYFDEMWRIDMIRDSNPFARAQLHDTPIAPGWLGVMHVVASIVPTSRALMRFVALVPAVIGVTFLGDVLRSVVRRPGVDARAAAVIAGLSTWLVCMLPGFTGQRLYFNNYGTEVLVAGLLVWAVHRLDTSDRSAVLLVVVIALAPWLTMGALLLVPYCLWVVWRHRATVLARCRTWGVAAAGVVALSGLLTAYFGFYRPVSAGGTVADFWRRDSLEDNSVGSFLRQYGERARDALVPGRQLDANVVVTVLAIVALGVGVVVVARRWPAYLWLVLSAQLLALLVSVTTGWPATLVRLNQPFLVPLALLVPLGFLSALHALAMRWRVSWWGQVAGLAASSALVAVAVWPVELSDDFADPAVFARGFTADLGEIGPLMGERAIVVAYHPMSHWYVDDALVHDGPPGDVVILREELDDESLFTDLDAALAQVWTPGTDVWCVIPFESGPDDTAAACKFDTSGFEKVFEGRTRRATVIGYRPTDSAD